jgi:TetR/AcrR family transcriptional regulator, fatty acid metabolism regulator protein
MRIKEGEKEKDILDAAILVFGEFGYAKAKMQDIAARANIAIGTVYLYFKNKEQIILHIFDTVWGELAQLVSGLRENAAMTPQHKVTALIDELFDRFTRNQKLMLVFINEHQHVIRAKTDASFLAHYRKVLADSERIIAEGQTMGLFNAEVSSRYFHLFLFGGIRYALLRWAAAPREIGLAELRQTCKTVILHGLLAPQKPA